MTEHSITLTISNKKGLHARAAAKFVRIAEDAKDTTILVEKDNNSVDGRSIMGLLMLSASIGKHIKLTATGKHAEETLIALTALINRKFDEDE